MLKQIAWNTFKKTGNINTFMELLEVDKAIKNTNDKNELSMQNREGMIDFQNGNETENKINSAIEKNKEKQWEL